MADNVAITAGSGTSIATDDVAGVHYQRIKLAVGPADDATVIGHAEDAAHASGDGGIMALQVRKDSPASTAGTDGDYAPATQDASGSTWVRPRGGLKAIQVTPSISSGSAYTSGDQIGGLMDVANAALTSGGSGYVVGVTVVDKTQAQRAAMDIFFYDRSITTPGDNAAVNVSDADQAYLQGFMAIGPYNTAFPGTPLNSVSSAYNIGLPFVLNGTSLYALAVVRGTPTYGSTSDLIFTFFIQPLS